MKRLAPARLSCVLLLLAAGCKPAAIPVPSKVPDLEAENEALQERLRDQETFLRTYSAMMNDVLRNLRSISEDEERVLEITRQIGRDELGYRKQDYRQEIGDLMASIDEKLRQGERAKSELQILVARRGEEATELRLAVLELENDLQQRQARIQGLRAEVERLQLENQTLENRVASERQRRLQEEDRARRLQVFTHAYLLVASKSRFKRMRRTGILRRSSGDLELTPGALSRRAYETALIRVDGSVTEISLGRGIRKTRVRSVHRSYPNLYGIERRGAEHVLVLRHPAAFWRVSRFLIVQVQP